MIFWTSDEHYNHNNIRTYSDRPFASVEEMDEELIRRHNEIVKDNDLTIHVGDFSLIHSIETVHKKYVNRLKGKHFFLKGSHDRWLPANAVSIREDRIDGQVVVACHYAMRVWPRSHYGSWQVFGHSHGRLPPLGKQHDVGVDNNDFRPVSFERLKEIMATREDNPNLIRIERKPAPPPPFGFKYGGTGDTVYVPEED